MYLKLILFILHALFNLFKNFYVSLILNNFRGIQETEKKLYYNWSKMWKKCENLKISRFTFILFISFYLLTGASQVFRLVKYSYEPIRFQEINSLSWINLNFNLKIFNRINTWVPKDTFNNPLTHFSLQFFQLIIFYSVDFQFGI